MIFLYCYKKILFTEILIFLIVPFLNSGINPIDVEFTEIRGSITNLLVCLFIFQVIMLLPLKPNQILQVSHEGSRINYKVRKFKILTMFGLFNCTRDINNLNAFLPIII